MGCLLGLLHLKTLLAGRAKACTGFLLIQQHWAAQHACGRTRPADCVPSEAPVGQHTHPERARPFALSRTPVCCIPMHFLIVSDICGVYLNWPLTCVSGARLWLVTPGMLTLLRWMYFKKTSAFRLARVQAYTHTGTKNKESDVLNWAAVYLRQTCWP